MHCMSIQQASVVPVVLFALALPVRAAPLLGHDFGSMLYDVDTQTGAASDPRDTGLQFENLTGIALSPGGVLYGLSDCEWLYTIDPATGAAVRVAGVPLPFGEGDIDFDPTTGTLYGVGFSTGLVTIDPSTGDATTVGGLQGVGDASAMAFNAAGSLYVLDTGNDGLLEVDKSDGSILAGVTLSTPLGSAAGMDFDPETGLLYVADGETDSTDTLYTLGISTGTLTPIGTTLTGGMAGLEFIPEPTTVSLLAIGGLGLMRRRPVLR